MSKTAAPRSECSTHGTPLVMDLAGVEHCRACRRESHEEDRRRPGERSSARALPHLEHNDNADVRRDLGRAS